MENHYLEKAKLSEPCLLRLKVSNRRGLYQALNIVKKNLNQEKTQIYLQDIFSSSNSSLCILLVLHVDLYINYFEQLQIGGLFNIYS